MNEKKEITVITTHINADFDAMASMLAAQKLYPDALVVFPGSQEKNLRNFFIDSMVYLFNMADIKEIDFAKVHRLVLVDTRQPRRIGKLSSLLERDDLEIHIYDHHPANKEDIRGDLEHIRTTGATVSILAGILRDSGINLTADEATIMCLGIYEDTGSFTFPSTTGEDFQAAAFLLGEGADLNIVSDLIAREITPEQVGLLNDMIQAASHHNINGVEVVVTFVSSERFVADFAFLVHKMVKMENLDAIFAMGRMGEKVYIVARSRIPEVDAGAIVTPLGGGGHAFAAAATIRGKTLAQVEQSLIDILYRSVKARRRARDLMSSPAIFTGADVDCKTASALLTRYNVNAILVTGKKEGARGGEALAGYISRQVIEKALFHELDHVPVKEYMNTEFASVGPDADLLEIQDKIIENKQRILPVVDKGDVVGVLTRTDLLNILVRQSRRFPANAGGPIQETSRPRTRNIIKFMRERLSGELIDILRGIGESAEKLKCRAYVVGGFVRDLYLYRRNQDIDIVIEGDGIAFSRKYAREVGGRIHAHAKFGTAVVIFPNGFKVDVASARLEYYKFPAALPTVETSSIKLDMYRRDFTINTMTICLNPDNFGGLLDFFNALRDIKDRAIRVLHNLSFVEDPTRIFRAIRFEQRFNFTIGKLSSNLIENAVSMNFFKRLSGRRVFSELRQILEEENPTPALIRLKDYDLIKVIHPSITLDQNLTAMFDAVKKVLAWHDLLFLEDSYIRWIVFFIALVRMCKKSTTEEICRRFELAPRHRKIFCEERFEAERRLHWLEKNLPVKNSILYHRLQGFRTELLLFMMAVTRREEGKKAISKYFTRLRYVRTMVTGRDLKAMGWEPGPLYREIFQAVLRVKLDGGLRTYREELEFARAYKSGDSPDPSAE
ncbi:MAG: CBS domain-containing protein [Desulfobacterales bacterium]|nr:CBS domain-containing protein [Desulfobacterales bacterium]